MSKEFHEVGCRACGKGGDWKIFTNGKGDFRAEHKCGHITDFTLTTKPDSRVIPIRML